jgi:hypothetical protein
MLKIEARGIEDLVARLGDLDHGEALAIEMPAQRRQKLCRVDADHEADLRARPAEPRLVAIRRHTKRTALN